MAPKPPRFPLILRRFWCRISVFQCRISLLPAQFPHHHQFITWWQQPIDDNNPSTTTTHPQPLWASSPLVCLQHTSTHSLSTTAAPSPSGHLPVPSPSWTNLSRTYLSTLLHSNGLSLLSCIFASYAMACSKCFHSQSYGHALSQSIAISSCRYDACCCTCILEEVYFSLFPQRAICWSLQRRGLSWVLMFVDYDS